jgi:1,5-anhydro-D-fructose reductase (1,5-anhydro-D-mannitol-forming)
MIQVGIIGLGGMGGVHFGAYKNSPQAKLVAVCDVDVAKFSGGGVALNIGGGGAMDLSGLKTYSSADDLIYDPDVQLVDICLPTSRHAAVAIKALRAGKHVFCEKPIALTDDEAAQMEAAQRESGKQLMIGHCLRFWPQYVKAHDLIASGEYGAPLYARFHRSGATPTWSWDGWLQDGARSGGAVLDMHIHDADTAMWWFGAPQSIHADGITVDHLPMSVDATWRYENGLLVYLHGSWDNNGGPFRMAFKVVMERGTVEWDSSKGDAVLLHTGGETQEFPVSSDSAYATEIEEFLGCVASDTPMTKVTPAGSRATLQAVLEEMRQINCS